MASRFKKKCSCHGTKGLVPKKEWKALKRNHSILVCSRGVLESGAVYQPYVPLMSVPF